MAQVVVMKMKTKQEVVDRQIFLDQLGNTIKLVNSYLEFVKENDPKSPVCITMNGMVSTSLNAFAKQCNSMLKDGDKESMVIGSAKLKEYAEKLGKDDMEKIRPMLEYMYCCLDGRVDCKKDYVGLHLNEAAVTTDFNEKNVSSGFGSWLQAGHKIDDDIAQHEKNAQRLNDEHDKIAKKLKNKVAKIDNLGSTRSVPSTQDIYRLSGNLKYRTFEDNDAKKKALVQQRGGYCDYDHKSQANVQGFGIGGNRYATPADIKNAPNITASGDKESDDDDSKHEFDVQMDSNIKKSDPTKYDKQKQRKKDKQNQDHEIKRNKKNEENTLDTDMY